MRRFTSSIELASGIRDVQRAIRESKPDLLDATVVKLDAFERRLVTYLGVQHSDREQYCMAASGVFTLVHNTNTYPALSYQQGKNWVSSGNIVPPIRGIYRVDGLFLCTTSMPAASRIIGHVQKNRTATFGVYDRSGTSGAPDFCTSGRYLEMNGTTDDIEALCYQFWGGGSSDISFSAWLVASLVHRLS